MPVRVGDFKNERARAHFLAVYDAALAELPAVAESLDVSTSFGRRSCGEATSRTSNRTGP